MLIIEGADLMGKTTLAHALLKELTTHIYCHFTRLPKDFDYYGMYIDRMSPFIVQDRFHMSEIVYATVRGEEPNITPLQYRLLDAHALMNGAFTVVLYSDDDLIRSRWREGEMYTLDRVIAANFYFRKQVIDGCVLHRDMEVDARLQSYDREWKAVIKDIITQYTAHLKEIYHYESNS